MGCSTGGQCDHSVFLEHPPITWGILGTFVQKNLIRSDRANVEGTPSPEEGEGKEIYPISTSVLNKFY